MSFPPAPARSWIPSLLEFVLGEERFVRFMDWIIESAPENLELGATRLAEARDKWIPVSKYVEYCHALERAGRDTPHSRMALRHNEIVLRGLERFACTWKGD